MNTINKVEFKSFPTFDFDLQIYAEIFKQEGDLAYLYKPFRNVKANGKTEGIKENQLIEIDTDLLGFSLNHPVDIQVLPSYDGTVNLILNDDYNPPRLINSRFTVKEDKRFEIIDRKGNNDTNIYDEDNFDLLTRLFKNYHKIPYVEFEGLAEGGNLKTGTYCFFFKYTDADGNESDIIAESGLIPVHLGSVNDPKSISGGIMNTNCNKIIKLKINNIDTAYDYINVYYTRDTGEDSYSDNLYYYLILDKKIISSETLELTITGFENTKEISEELVNVLYNIVDRVSTLALVLNMLFFGNVSKPTIPYQEFEDLSLRIHPKISNNINIGDLNYVYDPVDGVKENIAYYNMKNCYKYTGYWNNEIYRLGIVYIMKDDSLSPVFNVRGCNNLDSTTTFLNPPMYTEDEGIKERNYIITDESGYYNSGSNNLENTKGVIRINYTGNDIYQETTDTELGGLFPLALTFKIEKEVLDEIKKYAKGFFFVRLKRLPTILGLGLTIAVDGESNLPCLKRAGKFVMESFLTQERKLTHTFEDRLLEDTGSGVIFFRGLLSPELTNNKLISSGMFNNSDFILSNSFIDNKGENVINSGRHFYINSYENKPPFYSAEKSKLVSLNDSAHLKIIDEIRYSGIAGVAEEAYKVKYFAKPDNTTNATNLIRGQFTPYIGADATLPSHKIMNIHIPGYDANLMDEYFKIRFNSLNTFHAIGNRYDLNYMGVYENIEELEDYYEVTEYRGDCYISNVTVRMNRNFVDPETPMNDTIVDKNTWADNFLAATDINKKKDNTKINRADVNSVQLGHWVTFKVFSTINLALRSLDTSHADEQALMGLPRGFYPAQAMSAGCQSKMPESEIYNSGFKLNVSIKLYTLQEDVPYIKNIFDNRIMFSQRNVSDAFKNGYRVFLGLAYLDITAQYGAITKMFDWLDNILVVFENGVALLGINELALISTQSGLSIHFYGAGVLPQKETPISVDFGSRWKDSVIKTPIGIYGVDTEAKKIWRFSNNGFLILSDFKVLKFLNDHLVMDNDEYLPLTALRNVKTHYDNFKGDVIFTYYNCTRDEDSSFNLVYNERIDSWVTRVDWTPLLSENINNIFVTYNKDGSAKNIALSAYSLKDIDISDGIVLDNNEITIPEELEDLILVGELSLKGYDYYDKYTIRNYSIVEGDDYVIEGTKLYVKKEHLLEEDLIVENLLDTIKVQLSMKDEDGVNAPMFLEYLFIHKGGINPTYLYKHGLANLFDNTNNTTIPSTWYDLLHRFEFEFIVNEKPYILKIFNNLRIISNQVLPKKIIVTTPDDSYLDGIILEEIQGLAGEVVVEQDIKTINKFGRLRGNTLYKENIWDILILPAIRNGKLTRIRNKYATIRVIYETENLALISLILTLYTISYG